MADLVTIPKTELEELRNRVSNQAKKNAHLELINRMLANLSSVEGLENLIPHILSILMETVGGSNLAVYHTIEGKWFYNDIHGAKGDINLMADRLVSKAVKKNSFVKDTSAVGLTGEIWVFPLTAKGRTVGAVKMEGMQLTSDTIITDLLPFFVYAAIMLDNEISNYSALAAANQELMQKNREVQEEITTRRYLEERYRALFEQSPDGILIVDPATSKIEQFNTSAHSMLGYSCEEFSSLLMYDLETQESQAGMRAVNEVIRDKGLETIETSYKTKEGKVRDVRVTVQFFKHGASPLAHCIIRDITDSKRLEEELLKAEKLESVGLLAGGIAHDFNNLLTGIMGNISMAKMSAGDKEKMLKFMTDAEKASCRAGELTRQLLTFAKGGAPIKKIASLEKLITESAGFAVRGSNVRSDFSIPPALWLCEVDEGQINQVINNLVINAVQAMPAGGVLRISCKNVKIGSADPLPLDKGDYVKISIQDQGTGIPKELLASIFDPYFTTKQKGSGLGLATSYSIVKKHDGLITVESEMGKGTIFDIFLPAISGRVNEQHEEEGCLVSGRGKILVMDDEDIVREIITEMLKRLGYEVEGVKDGVEAIELYRKHAETGSPFVAVIMDLTIPGGMGGKEAIRQLRELYPEVKAIVSSGYSNDPIMAEYGEFGFAAVLAKPYKLTDLSHALSAVIPLRDNPC